MKEIQCLRSFMSYYYYYVLIFYYFIYLLLKADTTVQDHLYACNKTVINFTQYLAHFECF